MKHPHDTDIYELMTTPGAAVTVVAKGYTKPVIHDWPIPNTIDEHYIVDYPLEINHKK